MVVQNSDKYIRGGQFDIPLHRIRDFAPYGVLATLYGAETQDRAWDTIEKFPLHRDDHYFFLIVENGRGSLDIDFQRIELKEKELYVVTPGQLHGNIDARGCRGWVVLLAPDFVKSADRDVFARNMFRVRPHALSDGDFRSFKSVLGLLVDHFNGAAGEFYFERVLQSIATLFVDLAVRSFESTSADVGAPDGRGRHIASEYKRLIREHCLTQKSVQYYASALNITPGYLNEVINRVTGQSSSYWIQEEILLEAKRLLLATELTVKQISYYLGYDNYSYFNRMFRNRAGMTPLQFRRTAFKPKP